jgi:tripartite-type tricarboxylate transporter receptor subunit TctC
MNKQIDRHSMLQTSRHSTQDKVRRLFLAQLASVGVAVGLLPRISYAQADRLVRFVLPNATGSGVDAITRAAQPALAQAFGATVVIENQPGAGGIIGLQTLSKAAPDGTTLSVVSNNVVIFPSVLKALPFNMTEDFTPIASIGNTPLVIVVNPQKMSAVNSQEMIALLKAKPDFYNFGSGGAGTILHLATEMYLEQTKTKARHIPYKGVGPMVADLLGGQIDFGALALPSVQQHINSGALRAIGVGESQRTPAAPQIPTFVEQGMPNYIVDAWFMVLGPKGMDAATSQRVYSALVKAFEDPGTKEAMSRQGNNIQIRTPAETAIFFKAELEKYARLVKAAGIEPQ